MNTNNTVQNTDVSSWQIGELKLEKIRTVRIEAEQTLEIFRNITEQTRLETAKIDLQTALARLAIIKGMKEEIQPQTISETTGSQPEVNSETTAEEVPDQTATDSNIENPTPAPTSEAVEAPTENKAQPTTGGNSQSQGK